MTKFLGSLIVLAALALPGLVQAQQQMSPDDQQKFDNYYSRWQQDRQTGDRDDMVSSEHHMQDLMNKYSIPADTPYDQVASQNAPGYENRPYDNRGYTNQLPGDDQNKFNKEYTKWQQANAKNDRDDIDKHARNMEELMQRNNIRRTRLLTQSRRPVVTRRARMCANIRDGSRRTIRKSSIKRMRSFSATGQNTIAMTTPRMKRN